MRFYLAEQMADATEPHRGLLAIFLGGGWASLQQHYGLFPLSSPVFYTTLFWSLSWLLGASLAITQRKWCTRRATRSIARWLLWMFTLSVAWGFRDANVLGGIYIAGVIEVAIMLTEGSRVLRLAAIWADWLGIRGAKKLLNFFASTVDSRIQKLEDRAAVAEDQSATNAAHIATNAAHIESLEAGH